MEKGKARKTTVCTKRRWVEEGEETDGGLVRQRSDENLPLISLKTLPHHTHTHRFLMGNLEKSLAMRMPMLT